MPEIEVNIEIICTACGNGLCNQSTATTLHGKPAFSVEPCQVCLERIKDAGDTEGYDRGYKDGKNDYEVKES